jgi:hypothetical protein
VTDAGCPFNLCLTCKDAFELGQVNPSKDLVSLDDRVECTDCDADDPNEIESTYCGSYCQSCLSDHLDTCEICRADWPEREET